MTTSLLLLGVLCGVVLSAFVSGSETGVYSVNPVRLRVASERGSPAARRLEQLLRRTEDLVITMLLGNAVADYLATACMTALFLRAVAAESLAEVYATALVTPLLFVFGGVIPKECFRRHSNRLLLALNWVLWSLLWLARATGLVWLLHGVSHALVRWVDPQGAATASELLPRARTLYLLREGAARGGLTHLQRDLIERVLNLSDVRVGHVMIPRSRAAAAPVETPRDDFLRIARMAHFSRLPVYRAEPRRILGIVNVYDVLTDPTRQPVAAYVRPPIVLPPHLSVPAALLRMQRARQTMAIVQDGAGHCLGILTLKDLVEEIVGDLEVW